MGFKSFCTTSKLFLTGSWSLARVKGAVFGSGRVPVSKLHPTGDPKLLTRRNLGTSCSEQVNGPLHVVDARREVCAALQQLHLLSEVVHGVGSGRLVGGGYDKLELVKGASPGSE